MATGLNSEQEKALNIVDNPVLILAGAGSGKTKVITEKFCHLVKNYGMAPWRILAVTFTNKAAKELKERSVNQLGEETSKNLNLKGLWVGTFHSICGRILRRDIEPLGYTGNFTIYDMDDSKRVIKDIIKRHGIKTLDDKGVKAQSIISAYKNKMFSPNDLALEAEKENNLLLKTLADVYKLYQVQLKKNNAIDFDDMMLLTIELFRQFPEVRAKYQAKFDYFLVDEFQDTNVPQYTLIRQLLGDRHCISVVGDDDQSIYSWRGAVIANILNFSKDFKNAKTIKLEQNYRSTNAILKAANSIISKNNDRLGKDLWSDKEEGELLSYYQANDERGEANIIISLIAKERKNNPKSSIACFYRMNYQARLLEEGLRKTNIPYQIYGSVKFYDRKEIKDILGYLILINNIKDNVALMRVINTPKRRIGDASVQTLFDMAAGLTSSLFEAIPQAIDAKQIKGPARNSMLNFHQLICGLVDSQSELNLFQLFEHLVDEINFFAYLREDDELSSEDRIANVKELANSIMVYQNNTEKPTLTEFLNQVTLVSDLDKLTEAEANTPDVILMTIHNSKGLEFDTVFLTGMDDGIFPHRMSFNDPQKLAEERRLCYVGITRGREKVYISRATKRTNFGQDNMYPESRFIREINPELLRKETQQFNGPTTPTGSKFERFSQESRERQKIFNKIKTSGNMITSMDEVTSGMKVYHHQFGQGYIQDISTSGSLETVTVKFSQSKQLRRLILKYANLSKEPIPS